MSVIASLRTTQSINRGMVKRAIREAQQDPGKVDELKVISQECRANFEPAGYDQLIGFLQQYYADRFELRDTHQGPVSRPPEVDVAKIWKEREEWSTVYLPSDPLVVEGTAPAGAMVVLMNASVAGRPVLEEIKVGPEGTFAFKIEDPTTFAYGDQVALRVVEKNKEPSRDLIVPTRPLELVFMRERTVRRGGGVVGTRDLGSEWRSLHEDTDERPPFYQEHLDKVDVRVPSEAGEPYALELVGGKDTVEPFSELTVETWDETYKTKADENGKFGLKVFGFTPGEVLKLQVRDIHGNGVDIPLAIPQIELDPEVISTAAKRPPTPRRPSDVPIVGEGPPWLVLKAKDATGPYHTLVFRDVDTGALFETKADKNGDIAVALGGVDCDARLEVSARDVNDNPARQVHTFMVTENKIGGGFLATPDDMAPPFPNLQKMLRSVKGPPKDLFLDGQRQPEGPYLDLPGQKGFPPNGTLEIVRDGKVLQSLFADEHGRLDGMLRGVQVSDPLSFRVKDAFGRKYPEEVHDWLVPGPGDVHEAEINTPANDASLGALLGLVGSGTIPLVEMEDHAKLFAYTNPRDDTVGSFKEDEEGRRWEYRDPLPPGMLPKVVEPAQKPRGWGWITLEPNAHHDSLYIHVEYEKDFRRHDANFGIDKASGEVRAGWRGSNEISLPRDIGKLQVALRSALTFVGAAYAEGLDAAHPAYAYAMDSAKALLFAFDHLAAEHPDHKDALVIAAKEAFVQQPFPFEQVREDRVPPKGVAAPTLPPTNRPQKARRFWGEVKRQQDEAAWEERRSRPFTATIPRYDAQLRNARRTHWLRDN